MEVEHKEALSDEALDQVSGGVTPAQGAAAVAKLSRSPCPKCGGRVINCRFVGQYAIGSCQKCGFQVTLKV